jgi:hypothetical protein
MKKGRRAWRGTAFRGFWKNHRMISRAGGVEDGRRHVLLFEKLILREDFLPRRPGRHEFQ